MLGHPAFVSALVGSDTESKALLAEQYVSAVAGVDGPDCVVLEGTEQCICCSSSMFALAVETS